MKVKVMVFHPLIQYCPSCGSTSIELEGHAMEGVYAYHRYYCQDCGTTFKVLQKWQKQKVDVKKEKP